MRQLQDPRWQRKRLEIMDRDGWMCVACGASDKELHVHHLRYTGRDWEASNEDLQTLCHECHDKLGEHPKGGVGYNPDGTQLFIHCPQCGNVDSSRDLCGACGRGLSITSRLHRCIIDDVADEMKSLDFVSDEARMTELFTTFEAYHKMRTAGIPCDCDYCEERRRQAEEDVRAMCARHLVKYP